MTVIYTILAFLIGFTLMVLVHEWGHYITGRIFKTKIDEFAIGMGPKIFSKKGKKTNTVFSLRCIPIGGFVKFAGDDEVYGEQTDVNDAADPHLLPNLAVWKRFIIYAAGAFMNVVLGFVLLVSIYLALGVATNTPTIGTVIENSPAYVAGLQKGDIILKIDGNKITHDNYELAIEQISELIGENEVIFTVKRNDDTVDLTITPQYDDESESYKVGFYFGYTYRATKFGEAITMSAQTSGEMMSLIFKTLANLIFKGEGIEDVGGPIAIISVISDATREGILQIVSIFASLTLNLAVVNMIPFPALDGGKCLLLLIEAITRKPINKNVEGWLNLVGFAVLMLLMVVIGVKDVFSLFN